MNLSSMVLIERPIIFLKINPDSHLFQSRCTNNETSAFALFIFFKAINASFSLKILRGLRKPQLQTE